MKTQKFKLSQACLEEIKRLGKRTGKRAYTDQQIADYLFARGLTNRVVHWTTVNNYRVQLVGYRWMGWKKRANLLSKRAEQVVLEPDAMCDVMSAPEPDDVPSSPTVVIAASPAPACAPAPAPAAAAPMNDEDRLARLERVLAQVVELQLRTIQKTT